MANSSQRILPESQRGINVDWTCALVMKIAASATRTKHRYPARVIAVVAATHPIQNSIGPLANAQRLLYERGPSLRPWVQAR
jgi:hypothetical protein